MLQPDYRASDHISATAHPDPYVRPAFSFGNRARRALWNTVWLLLFRPTPRPFHAWRLGCRYNPKPRSADSPAHLRTRS